MGDTQHDPIDDFRTTRLHAGESMIDVYHWPGLFPVAVGVIALTAKPIRRITFVDNSFGASYTLGLDGIALVLVLVTMLFHRSARRPAARHEP